MAIGILGDIGNLLGLSLNELSLSLCDIRGASKLQERRGLVCDGNLAYSPAIATAFNISNTVYQLERQSKCGKCNEGL